jgi:hypothetical protein
MITINEALNSLRPGAEWTLDGSTYAGIVWLDQVQTKPTEQEVNNKIVELTAAETTETQRLNSINLDSDLVDLLIKARTMNPTQWKAITDGITNIAQAQAMFYRMGLLLMLLVRRL